MGIMQEKLAGALRECEEAIKHLYEHAVSLKADPNGVVHSFSDDACAAIARLEATARLAGKLEQAEHALRLYVENAKKNIRQSAGRLLDSEIDRLRREVEG